jgi:hypothetical protein
MPIGPKGQKRPADVNARAVMIARIATAEVNDAPADDGKDPAATALGKKGGAARAKSMTPERRAEIAKKASSVRWAKRALSHRRVRRAPVLQTVAAIGRASSSGESDCRSSSADRRRKGNPASGSRSSKHERSR